MKNIYNDNDTPQGIENISSGTFEFGNTEVAAEKKEAPQAPVISHNAPRQPYVQGQQSAPQSQQPTPQSQQQYAQPQYVQQPYYYAVQPSPYQQYPYQAVPVQMTPEQYAAFIQQYPQQYYAQPYPQQQYPGQPYGTPVQYGAPTAFNEPSKTDNEANDSGMRVLYQSVDFDRPAKEPEPEENYDDFNPDDNISQEPAAEEKPVPKKPSFNDEPFTIEEETVSMPVRKPEPPKPTLKIEEMEMSTFELNSILGKQSYTRVKPEPQPTVKAQANDAPLNFGNSFSVEDTVDETVTDIASDESAVKENLPVSEIIRRCILGISIVAIVIAAAMLLNEYRLSKENDNLEEGISNLIVTEPTEPVTEATAPDNNEKTTKEAETTTAPLTPEQQWAKLQSEYPNLIFPQGLQLKYAKLYATNQDFVGYLEAKGINLSLPIVQTNHEDTKSPYLKKNFYGKSTKYGCPFVTHLNNIVDLDRNTVIFGHHMNNGTVFGALDKYKTIDGFKAAPVITFNTLYKDYSWKVIAAFVTNAYEEEDNGYIFRYYFTSLSTEERFAAYLNELSQRSLYDTGVDVLPTDKLLTLSTCSHEFDDARFVVVARLVRNGESTEVDVSKATVNPSPRYPQAYYSKKKLTNPYVDAYRWEVD